MKRVLLSVLFIALIGIIYADNDGAKSGEPSGSSPALTITLTGKVIDFNSGEALTGVEVKIEGTDIRAYTDFDGNFEIEDVIPGKYNIIASYISYNKSFIENFNADKKDCRIDIKLQSSN